MDTNETSVVRQSNESDKSKDIVDTAIAAGTFKTLVAAVQAAGLVDSLKGKGPLTVFAPSDEAFSKLPEGT
ncbi:MAG: fasciclin domain-containing protein, partial [Planctomycetota bacterium]